MLVRGAYRQIVGDRDTRSAGLRASVAGSLAGKATEMVTLVALATVVPRVLGPADYGRFSVPLTVVTIGSLAMTLGGPTMMARYVPTAPPDDRVALARAIGARLARGRALQLGGIGALTGLVIASDPDRFPPVLVATVFLALALNVVATLELQVTLGLGRTGPWSTRYPLQNAVLIAAVLVLHPVFGRAGGVAAILIAAAAAASFGAACIRPVLATPAAPVALPEGAIRFGVLQAGGAALVQFAQRGGVLAVALLADSDAETGFAALAIGIALGATYAVLQAFTVSLPHLARRGRQDLDPVTPAEVDREVRLGEATLRRLAGGLLVPIVPAALIAVLLLESVVPSVFGTGFEGAVECFGPALALMVLAPLNALAVQSAALRMRPEVALASGAAAAGTFVLAAVALVPTWEATGGTAAALAGGAAGAAVAIGLLPGAVGARIGAASFTGAAGVLALGAIT